MNSKGKIALHLQSSAFSLQELAQKLNIPEFRLEQLISGYSPTIHELLQISKLDGVSVQHLLEGERGSQESEALFLIDQESKDAFAKANTNSMRALESYRIPGFAGKDLMLFRVQGKSMEPCIAEDDYLICKKEAEPFRVKDQSIAVVQLKEQILVKRIFSRGAQWELRSEHPEFEDQIVEPEELTACWTVVGKITREFLRCSKKEFLQIMKIRGEMQDLKEEFKKCGQMCGEFTKRLS